MLHQSKILPVPSANIALTQLRRTNKISTVAILFNCCNLAVMTKNTAKPADKSLNAATASMHPR